VKGGTLWLLAGTLLLGLLAVPLLFPGGYGGADDGAEQVLTEAGHEPWFSPVYQPPSGEVESTLFAIQAAVGGILIGYYVGRLRSTAEE